MKPGIYALSADQYHSDPCEQPSLSRTIAHLLCSSSPAHARAAHSRLNPAFEREEKEIFDLGTCAHALFLEGETGVAVIDAADWRTNAAKEARDEARAAGRIPLLAKHWDAVQEMSRAAFAQLAVHDAAPALFQDGKSEQTLIWEEPGGAVCRALADWLRDDRATIDDYKTTSRTANPESWSRSLFGSGYDVQAAFYLRGLEALTGAQAEFRFAVQETFPPYALSVIALGPDVLTLARKKIDYALGLWRRCLESGQWPAYSSQVCWAELPPWEEARWLAKEERELVSPIKAVA